ncbi:uncharacterized protein LOC111484294 isoform X2 [Cucurbita maxima]|uniref:Uncharacterized protein LOC111484294 isoform X2 n=1 Tax=Cucurbita maxima TaxID=3661 RepID=A0A6J1JEH8_CUCMA|nr:uncharacterized protein LOC111484294 isoform X2 [Cucurbita maxima]
MESVNFYDVRAAKMNAILKYRQFSAKDPSKKNSVADLYEEFVQNSEKNQKTRRAEIEYRVKQIDDSRGNGNGNSDTSIAIKKIGEIKHYQRSESEKIGVVQRENPHRELRRSETEKYKKIVRLSEETRNRSSPEDRMSNEEFRQTVEAFIARQQRLRREEEFCVF